jgi:hypothetical protein
VVDRSHGTGEVSRELEHVSIVYGDELEIPEWPRFAFQYDAFELVCALKPSAIRYALARGYARVVYFDGDTQVYSGLDDLFDILASCSVVLTPHITAPLVEDGSTSSEHAFVRAGAYNAGFLGTRESTVGRCFLNWWSTKLRTTGINDLAGRSFVDQAWLDLVPGLFDEVCIARNAGWNVGYYNLPQRNVAYESGRGFLINGEPLVFFHFSGFDPQKSAQLTRHQNRLSLDGLPVVRRLIGEYAKLLGACGREEYSNLAYGYATLSDGTVIRPLWREAVRTNQPELRAVQNPFDIGESPDLVERLRALEERMWPMRVERRLQRLRAIEGHWALSRVLSVCTRLVRLGEKLPWTVSEHPAGK